jgi:hypothetical protein
VFASSGTISKVAVHSAIDDHTTLLLHQRASEMATCNLG